MLTAGLMILGQIDQLKDPFASISDEEAKGILFGFIWLFLAAFALLIVAMVARKWLKSEGLESSDFDGQSQYTLNDLRKMRDDGLMSQEEFDKAKIGLLARRKSVVEKEVENDELNT